MKNRGARHGFHNCWQLSENAHEMTFQCSVWNRELQPAGYFPWIRDCGRNSNPPLHTWVRAAAVDKWWKHAKVKTVLSARKVMATVFWDSQGIVLVDCLEMGKIIIRPYAELSDCLLWSCWRWTEEKIAKFGTRKGVVSLGQRDIPQIDCRNGKPVRTGFRIGSSSNSFLGISPMQLLHVPKLWNLTLQKNILEKLGCHQHSPWLLCRASQNLVFWWDEKLETHCTKWSLLRLSMKTIMKQNWCFSKSFV